MSEYLSTEALAALDAAAAAAPTVYWYNTLDDDGEVIIEGIGNYNGSPELTGEGAIKAVAFVDAADPATVRALIAEVRARRRWDQRAARKLYDLADDHGLHSAAMVADDVPPIPGELTP